jgi:hypothetical protein
MIFPEIHKKDENPVASNDVAIRDKTDDATERAV